MMDEKNTNHPEGCRCWLCQGHGMHCCGRHHWAWLLVKLVIIVLVFWLGVKVGELKSMIGYSRGYPGGGYYYNMQSMMRGGNAAYGPTGYGPGMMGGYWLNATTTQK